MSPDLSPIVHIHTICPRHGATIHRWVSGFCPVPACRWRPVFIDGLFVRWEEQ